MLASAEPVPSLRRGLRRVTAGELIVAAAQYVRPHGPNEALVSGADL